MSIDPSKFQDVKNTLARFVPAAKALIELGEACGDGHALMQAVAAARDERDRLMRESADVTATLEAARDTVTRLSASKATLDRDISAAGSSLAALRSEHDQLAPVVTECRAIAAELPGKQQTLADIEARLTEIHKSILRPTDARG